MLNSVVFGVLFENLLLVLNTVAVALIIIITGQAAVKRCDLIGLPIHLDLHFRQSPHK